MQDQVSGFKRKGITAETLNSDMRTAERKEVVKDLESDQPTTKLLFVSPELLATDS